MKQREKCSGRGDQGSYSIMAEHILGKEEIQVQFLLRAPNFATLADVVIAVV